MKRHSLRIYNTELLDTELLDASIPVSPEANVLYGSPLHGDRDESLGDWQSCLYNAGMSSPMCLVLFL